MPGTRGVVLGLVGFAAGCTPGRGPPPPAPDAAAEVRTALALAVGLLEANDRDGFVSRFPPPPACPAADPAPMLPRLRQLRGMAPAFADGGATAVFDSGSARAVFRRVAGRWELDWD